jgi:hypothetical protein
MARMSIDDLFLRDPRVRAMANALEWSKYEARGRLLDVFAVAYDRVDSGGEPILTPEEIDIAAEFDGLASAMMTHKLAVQVRGGLYIKGSDERTKYLSTRESSGRLGGIKSGESRRNKSKVTNKPNEGDLRSETKVTFGKNEGPLNPSASASASADPTASVSDGVTKIPRLPRGPRGTAKAAQSELKEIPERRRVTDAFNAYFAQTNNGSKPTWEGRPVKELSRLLSAHCADELVRRIGVLSTSPPKFPPQPWDFPTFAQHVDKVAAPTRGDPRGSSQAVLDRQLEHVRELEAEEAAQRQLP